MRHRKTEHQDIQPVSRETKRWQRRGVNDGVAAAVAAQETATEPTHRVALAHPLISRALRDRELDTKRSSSSSHRRGGGGVQEQLRQLQAERTAHLEMLEMMTQQAQALLREKQQLHASAAALEAQNAQLEERLDYFLGGRDEQERLEWADEGPCRESTMCSSPDSSGECQPDTPTAASLGTVASALHDKLEGLEEEQLAHGWR
ncbi:hypothetical protein ACK3TF_004436 [Chlorella vulgaris]